MTCCNWRSLYTARVIFAIASSSTTRCGLLLSSEIAGGTALGSTLNSPFLPAPRVGGFNFIGEGTSGVAAVTVPPFAIIVSFVGPSLASISRAIAVMAASACFCAFCSGVSSFACALCFADSCFGLGYSAISWELDFWSVGIDIHAGVHGTVVDGLGVQLLVDPLRQAQLFHMLHVSGSWTVRQPIQRMQHGLIDTKLADRQPLQNYILLRFIVTGFGNWPRSQTDLTTEHASG